MHRFATGPTRLARSVGEGRSDRVVSEATQKRRRLTYVVWVLLIATAVVCAFSSRTPDSRLQVQWEFRNWHFGSYERRDTIQIVPVFSILRTDLARHWTAVTEGYHLGPMNVFKTWG